MFKWYGSTDGSEPIVQKMLVKDAEVLTLGMVVSVDTGEIDKGATNDTAFVGITVQGVDNTNDGEYVHVIINPNAIYRVEDANVRVAGATLDLATSAIGVTTSSNADFVVVAASAADEPTLVIFSPGNHYLT